jgi:hypothetical protein
MRRATVYSLVVFLLVASYSLAGLFTQLLLGVVNWGDAPLVFGLVLLAGGLIAGIFHFAFTKIAKKFGPQEKTESTYLPGRPFVVGSLILLALSCTLGAMRSYSVGSEQLVAARKQKDDVESRRLAAERAAEIERQRVAALSPKERAAEDKQKRDKATAAAKNAADEAARKEAEKARILADKSKRDTQLQLAGAGAMMLKRAMKDPEAFELKSLVVMPNGAACYEYRAKNSFGAILPSNAMLTSARKMLLQERDGNAFVSVWNKNCTISGGDEIAPLVKQLGILD